MPSPRIRPAPACAALLAAACGLLLAGVPAGAAFAPDPNAEYVHADLIARDDAAVPGQPAVLGLRLRHVPHWHTYWIMPGDAGLPTQLKWQLDPGYRGGSLQWPLPTLLRVGELANYGYEGTVVLPVTVQVPAAAAAGGSARFAAHVDYLVCNDLCIPGSAELALTLPLRGAAERHPGPDADAIAAALRQVPAPLRLHEATATRRGQRIALEFDAAAAPPRSLAFFPYEGGRIEAAAEQPLRAQGRRVHLELQAAAPVAGDFQALRGVLVADGGPLAAATGWTGSIDLPLRSAAAAAAGPVAPVAVVPPAAAPAPAAPAPAPASERSGASPPAPAASLDALTLLLSLAGAFVGGLILNLMPCVFPVLSLKLLGLVQHRNETPARMRVHGVAFAAGVIASFLCLALLLIGLRAAGAQVGWGFQLQSPVVITALLALFFLIGLNLLGAFEFTLGGGLVNRLANALPGAAAGSPADDSESFQVTFATGVLAAVVASPCTAPFMGAALGYAATQSAAIALLVFAALGAGMATPYFVLTFLPALLQRLPRPGAWMERLKQVMAFPMFLTCVWLFWVLGQQVDMDAVAGVLAALVAIGLWAWATGLAQRGARRWRWLAGAALLAAVALLAPLWRDAALPAAAQAALPAPAALPAAAWSPWSRDVQGLALAQGRPVFVDFTAAWCITCQANKRLVLHDAQVEQAFQAHGVLRLQADWTRRDEAISRELARLQRSGVPVYVLYDRQGGQHVLPEILSTQALLAALGAV